MSAKPVNSVMDSALSQLGRCCPVLASDRASHQRSAVIAAEMIGSSYSEPAKQKARSECLAHLRASLCPSVAAEQDKFNSVRAGV